MEEINASSGESGSPYTPYSVSVKCESNIKRVETVLKTTTPKVSELKLEVSTLKVPVRVPLTVTPCRPVLKVQPETRTDLAGAWIVTPYFTFVKVDDLTVKAPVDSTSENIASL